MDLSVVEMRHYLLPLCHSMITHIDAQKTQTGKPILSNDLQFSSLNSFISIPFASQIGLNQFLLNTHQSLLLFILNVLNVLSQPILKCLSLKKGFLTREMIKMGHTRQDHLGFDHVPHQERCNYKIVDNQIPLIYNYDLGEGGNEVNVPIPIHCKQTENQSGNSVLDISSVGGSLSILPCATMIIHDMTTQGYMFFSFFLFFSAN